MTKFTVLETHIGDRPHDPYLPGETREVDDEAQVRHLTEGDNPILGKFDADAERAFKARKDKPAHAPSEYERDGLADLDLAKANKDQLLVIAAYEQAEVPEGDSATKPQLVKAIEAKRAAA